MTLIADIRGYTRLAATFAEIVQEGVEASGGELVELRGDQALAVFASARLCARAGAGEVLASQGRRARPADPVGSDGTWRLPPWKPRPANWPAAI